MKKSLAVFLFALCLAFGARAQVIIMNDNLTGARMSEIQVAVQDSLSGEPISFASVYVIPSKDTTITNFTLTDAEGKAKLEEVPFGSYVLHVEMMGYKPYVKERYFRDRRVDIGTVKLQIDEHYLQAAVVSDVGNPIVVKQDTVEFNASAFRVGANAMLKDLIKRMPGMEITEDGKVKFNGEEIDHLTLGGKTFFFKDQSTALNNLPASIVDKVRVIDRESEATRASGIQDGSREKVLDVTLKKEYEKGWFGNAGIQGGTTLGKKDGDATLRDNRGLLYNGNALVSAYSEKDQLTVIANAQNIADDSGGVVVIFGEDGAAFNPGLSNAVQLGANANTTRIKDVETTVGANYKYSDTESGSRSRRTTYQETGDLVSTQDNSGSQYSTSVTANGEMKKENGKVWFHFRPEFRYGKSDSFSAGSGETLRDGELVNSSDRTVRSNSLTNNSNVSGDVTFRDLFGKTGRSLQFGASGSHNSSSGESRENSVLRLSGSDESRTMRYQSDGSGNSLTGALRYSEPLSEKLSLSVTGGFSFSRSENIRDAYDAAGLNDYYSSVNRTDYVNQQYGLALQYKFTEKTWLTLGGQMNGVLNETYSKSFGVEGYTGKDEWNWYLTPTMRFQHAKDNDRFNLNASGFTQRPGYSRMLPVLNVTDPSRLSMGNIYLKPSTQTYFSGSWTRNNREKFSTTMFYLWGSFNYLPVTSARWYDQDGIMYSIPVNSRKPGMNAQASLNYTTPLDAKKAWSLTFNGNLGGTSTTSYQTRGTLPGLDKETFDYSSFMESFWGDSSGDRFYGGKSGFEESKTLVFNPYASFSLKYNQDRYSFVASTSANGNISRYSLDPSINMNTRRYTFRGQASYTTKHEFEFNTDLAYVLYRGYSAGYGQPEWQWNGAVVKNVGAFTLSLRVHDILDQTRNLTHIVTENYEEDTYNLIMGRYILFGVKWNFGKMNSAHSQRAQNAAWNMVW